MTKEVVAGEGTGELDELQARMVEIASILQKKAPNLRPLVHPRLYKQTVEYVKTLVASKAGELAAAAAAAAAAENTSSEGEGHVVAAVSEELEEDGGRHHVVLELDTDVATRTFRITGAKLVGKIDATLSNLELLMDLHLNAGERELDPFIARFASANDFDSASGKTAASALQEVCSLAYALQVSASNISGWTGYVGSFQLPLAQHVDITAVVRELLTPPTAPPSPPRPKSAAGKKGKGRSNSKPKGAGGGAKKKDKAAAAGAVAVVGKEVGGPQAKEKGGKGTAAKGSKRKK